MSLEANRRLRLLLLTPFPPRLDGVHGGSRVTAQFLLHMAGRHDVGLLYFRGPEEPPLDDSLVERCGLIEEVSRRATVERTLTRRWLRYGRLTKSLLSLRPAWVSDWESRTFAERLGRTVWSFQPDIVQLEYHIMGQYLGSLASCKAPRVLVEHEAGVRAAPYIRQNPPVLGRLKDKLERLAWQRYEPVVLRGVQAVVAFTDHDRQVLAKLADPVPVITIRPGTVISPKSTQAEAFPSRLLFVGNFMHQPNLDAAFWLVKEIFPIVRDRCPKVELYLVGDNPPRELGEAAGANVHVTGRVPEIGPYLDQAALCVIPIRSGSGVRVKLLEALAAGKPVVATTLATEGLNVTDGEHLILNNQAGLFADSVLSLLKNPAKRAALAANARRWACEHLGWERSIRAYENLYMTLLGETSEDGIRR